MPSRPPIVGNPDDGFTSAEICDESDNYIGRLFELDDGFYVQVDQVEKLNDGKLLESLLLAKYTLQHYVNRKGADFSAEEWTREGISLYLMQRDDGEGFTVES